jgi:hypothetical protein
MEQKSFFEKIKLLLLFSMNIHGYSSSSPINFSKKLYFQKKNPVLLLIIINGIENIILILMNFYPCKKLINDYFPYYIIQESTWIFVKNFLLIMITITLFFLYFNGNIHSSKSLKLLLRLLKFLQILFFFTGTIFFFKNNYQKDFFINYWIILFIINSKFFEILFIK